MIMQYRIYHDGIQYHAIFGEKESISPILDSFQIGKARLVRLWDFDVKDIRQFVDLVGALNKGRIKESELPAKLDGDFLRR